MPMRGERKNFIFWVISATFPSIQNPNLLFAPTHIIWEIK
jgi:hypothetical protein